MFKGKRVRHETWTRVRKRRWCSGVTSPEIWIGLPGLVSVGMSFFHVERVDGFGEDDYTDLLDVIDIWGRLHLLHWPRTQVSTDRWLSRIGYGWLPSPTRVVSLFLKCVELSKLGELLRCLMCYRGKTYTLLTPVPSDFTRVHHLFLNFRYISRGLSWRKKIKIRVCLFPL